MTLKELSLFQSKKELFYLFLTLFVILSYSLLIEYNNYKNLTQFDSNIIQATVIKQYEKTKIKKNGSLKRYQVLQLKSKQGFKFYTTASKKLTNIINKEVTLELWAGNISFYEYLSHFYAYSKIIQVDKNSTFKEQLNNYLSRVHPNHNIASIYQALYSATPLPKELQTLFSNLGISHLLAISGFHLGVLSAILFFLFQKPYIFFQNRVFPYRNAKRDIFIITSMILLSYLLFLDTPPSLLRAFSMLIIAFFLYDRGFKVVSMQTLLLTLLFLLALFPRLVFSFGFWLSIMGVFYIFLFLIYFKHLSKRWQFILLPIWVYLLMLPYSLALFSNFSLYHPLSILWTSLFTLFYPLSMLLHCIGLESLFDNSLIFLLHLGEQGEVVKLAKIYLIIHIFLSLLSLYKKYALVLLLIYSLFILIYALYKTDIITF